MKYLLKSIAMYVFQITIAAALTAHGASMDKSGIVETNLLETEPAQNELNVPVSTDISVTFDVDMDEMTIDDSSFIVYATHTGFHDGAISYDNQTRTAVFDPSADFDVGEIVTVTLTIAIQSSDGTPLDNSYTWSFTTAAGDSPGTFDADSIYAVGDIPISIVVADLDGDTDPDLATANWNSNDVSVLMNNGNGTFAQQSIYPVGDGPRSVVAADLDGDGDIDLATANYYSDNITVLLNNGDGTFIQQSIYPVGSHPGSVFAADLDGDGDLDLSVANGTDSSYISILFNDEGGIFVADSAYPVGDKPFSVIAADLDSDGDIDLATANNMSADISVLLNNGDGVFAAQSVYPAANAPASIIAADFDGDGDLDLATANEIDLPGASGSLSVFVNDGNGVFITDFLYSVGDSLFCCPRALSAADLDADGDLDLAYANDCYPDLYRVSIFLNQLTFVCGDANGSGLTDIDDIIYLMDYIFSGGPAPNPLEAGDVNCLGAVNIDDVIYLIAYIFTGGPDPCDPDWDGIPNCP